VGFFFNGFPIRSVSQNRLVKERTKALFEDKKGGPETALS
jgi:hypothetical protein